MRMVILWSAVQEMMTEISDLNKRLDSFKKKVIVIVRKKNRGLKQRRTEEVAL